MTQLSALPFERSDEDRIIAGVCGGIASAIGVVTVIAGDEPGFCRAPSGAGTGPNQAVAAGRSPARRTVYDHVEPAGM